MRSEELEAIRQLPLFAGISEEGFQELTQAAFLQRFPAQVTLINEGEPADFLHVVLDGLVEMYARHGGRETILTIVEPIATFILAAVATDEVYLKSARTLTPTRVLMLPGASVRKVYEEEPAFARAVVLELSHRYREIVRELKNQKLRSGSERLAAWLLGQSAASEDPAFFAIPFEKRVLAARLGMTPENLSRAFATLGAYGVETSGREVRLNDIPALSGLARPQHLLDVWTDRRRLSRRTPLSTEGPSSSGCSPPGTCP